MHKKPFYGDGKRRAIESEVCAYIAEKTGSTPVYGFSEIIDAGDAKTGGDRISGFMENFRKDEWLVALSAKDGLIWKTAPVPESVLPKVSFVFSIGFGNGSPLPQPSGEWNIFVNDNFAISVRVVKHSQFWRNEQCSFAFTANRIEAAEPYESLTLSSIISNEAFAAFGPAFLTVPVCWLKPGEPAIIEIKPVSPFSSTRWIQLSHSPSILMQADIYRAVDMIATDNRSSLGKYNIYFGDIHNHSGQVGDRSDNTGCGMGSREDNYRYARGAGGVDFYALTDHEWQIESEKADEYLALADKFNEDNRFVCLPAFEFTSQLYGHRNVYFKYSGAAVVNANREGGRPTMEPEKSRSPKELWDILEKTRVPFITVPHHPSSASHPFAWEFFNPKYDRLVEIYSVWGSSEYYGDFPRGVTDRLVGRGVRDAIADGLRFGLIGSSDGHDGHPGNSQSPLVKHHHQFHFCGSGLTGVLANDLTRQTIFDALYNRRCYGTTGVPILLNVTLNGADMGQELAALSVNDQPKLTIECHACNGIDHIRIIKNGQIAHTVFCHGEWEYKFEWEDPNFTADIPNSYYVRIVQIDKESAWSSPIWIG